MRQRNLLPVSVRMFLLMALVSITSCTADHIVRKLAPPERYYSLDATSPFLKVHFKNGSIAVLDDWKAFSEQRYISGHGKWLDANRETIREGFDTIHFESVALFETNVVRSGTVIPELSVVTGLSLALSIYCLTNPKACFGSCPTFYAWDGERYSLMAEGFSSSVLPSLEANDIDALFNAVPRSRTFELRMTNEAYETHLIRSADILAVPRPIGGRVLHMTDGTLREATGLIPPATCIGPEGNILPALASLDTTERYSATDSTDLQTKETIDLRFEPTQTGHAGITIGFRQTLLTTYLFYQGLAYLGDSATAFLSRVESNPSAFKEYFDPFGRYVGGIEVLVQQHDDSWQSIGSFYETGPIAVNVQTISIPDNLQGTGNIRLRMTKGMWRLNYAAMAMLGPAVTPLRIRPSAVVKDSVAQPDELAILQHANGHVISMPGDVRTIRYELPNDYSDLELFLDARGYYLEWMRKEWLAETNPQMAAMMIAFTELFLRMEAPKFKAVESSLENSFWGSKYVHHD
jgi:hypothetical protein